MNTKELNLLKRRITQVASYIGEQESFALYIHTKINNKYKTLKKPAPSPLATDASYRHMS